MNGSTHILPGFGLFGLIEYKSMYGTDLCIPKQKMMGMFLHFLLVLLGVLTIVVLVQAQDQSGFISIDCGLPENSSYTEKTTGINYISDSKFINSGVIKNISAGEKMNHQQQLGQVRSFPSGVRNCYRINVTSGTKYLIRASFYYGNYDDLNELPQFDLYLGVNLWAKVKFTNAFPNKISEIIYTPSLDYIQPCLVNTGQGTPFISAIELRSLSDKTYNITDPAKSVLKLFRRLDIGSITNLLYRYRDDVYDRFWFPPQESDNWTRLSTSLSPGNLSQNDYEPPEIVMSTAATPVNASAPFEFSWDPDNVNDQYYIYMHFNEVEKLAENETRAFNITNNGRHFYGPVTPAYRGVLTVFSQSALPVATRYQFSLIKTENSTLPPILNAIEVYKVIDFSESETEQHNVDAITNIKNTYEVSRNWQGDPCAPVAYMWEGLDCSHDPNNLSSIISLDLSSSGLTGQIASSISNLTMLKHLDLSNNSLSGVVPEFLTELQSLEVLNLRKNNLTGLVPFGLLERSKTGSLSLNLEQNPNVCESESCNQQKSGQKKENNIAAIPVVLVSGILVLLVSS